MITYNLKDWFTCMFKIYKKYTFKELFKMIILLGVYCLTIVYCFSVGTGSIALFILLFILLTCFEKISEQIEEALNLDSNCVPLDALAIEKHYSFDFHKYRY